jgi:hypothetical protein
MKLTLTDVLVSSVSAGASGGQDIVTENISLNFAQYKIEYWPIKPDGSKGPVITTGFDLKRNQRVSIDLPSKTATIDPGVQESPENMSITGTPEELKELLIAWDKNKL